MKRELSLGSLLVLGSAWVIQSVHISPETPKLTQDDFDLGRFMGQWYELAVVSTCPHYMQRKRGTAVIVSLELQHVTSERNFTITATAFRNGTCNQMVTVVALTDLPGKFFHHFARFRADVYTHVVHTNYDEYALLLLLSTEQPSGTKTTTVKLYSRTVDVNPAVMDNFKTLVRKHGLSDDAIIVNQNRGECVPSQQGTEASSQPQIPEHNRSQSKVVPPVASDNV